MKRIEHLMSWTSTLGFDSESKLYYWPPQLSCLAFNFRKLASLRPWKDTLRIFPIWNCVLGKTLYAYFPRQVVYPLWIQPDVRLAKKCSALVWLDKRSVPGSYVRKIPSLQKLNLSSTIPTASICTDKPIICMQNRRYLPTVLLFLRKTS